jgi:hypothetical protein
MTDAQRVSFDGNRWTVARAAIVLIASIFESGARQE